MSTSRTEVFSEFPDRAFATFGGLYLGDFVAEISLAIKDERKYSGPSSMTAKTRGVRTAEGATLTFSVHGQRPAIMAILSGQSANPPQGIIASAGATVVSTSGNVNMIKYGKIPVATTAGLALATGVQTSSIKVFNQDVIPVSAGAHLFARGADYTCSAGKLIQKAGGEMSGNYPALILYTKADASAKKFTFGGRSGVGVGNLKIFFALDDSQGAGFEAYVAAPSIKSVKTPGASSSDSSVVVEVECELLADATRAVGDQIFRFVEGDF